VAASALHANAIHVPDLMVDFLSRVLDRPGAAQELARLLIVLETPETPDAAQAIAGAEQVLEQLRVQLARWFGADGAHALLARALDRARAEQPALASAVLESRGRVRLNSLATSAGDSLEHLTASLTLVIASFLTLLTRLIGADMVARVVQQAWPGEQLILKANSSRDRDPSTASARHNDSRVSNSD
jgi:hypothetical protein